MQNMVGRYVDMPAVFHKISAHIELMADVIKNTPTEILAENWECAVGRDRIRQWITLVTRETADIIKKSNAKSVLERIFTDNGLL